MAGDLPNIFASASGDVEAEILSPTISLSPDTEDQILDGDGTSIVIFEKADDHLTDPGGEAGARHGLRHSWPGEVSGCVKQTLSLRMPLAWQTAFERKGASCASPEADWQLPPSHERCWAAMLCSHRRVFTASESGTPRNFPS